MKNIFAKAVAPPKLVKPYGPLLGRVAAGIMVVMAVIHLFRIDTLVSIVNTVLPGGPTAAGAFVVAVILAEVFAIPFLLRMKLSRLAHLASGFAAIFAPLLWSLLSIWAYGIAESTGQLGQFVATPSRELSLALNVIWITLNFVTLWSLGYNNLKLKDVLKK